MHRDGAEDEQQVEHGQTDEEIVERVFAHLPENEKDVFKYLLISIPMFELLFVLCAIPVHTIQRRNHCGTAQRTDNRSNMEKTMRR